MRFLYILFFSFIGFLSCQNESTQTSTDPTVLFIKKIDYIKNFGSEFSPHMVINDNRLFIYDTLGQFILQYTLFGDLIRFYTVDDTDMTGLLRDSPILQKINFIKLDFGRFSTLNVRGDSLYLGGVTYPEDPVDKPQLTIRQFSLNNQGAPVDDISQIMDLQEGEYIQTMQNSQIPRYWFVTVRRQQGQEIFFFSDNNELWFNYYISNTFIPENSAYNNENIIFEWKFLDISSSQKKILLKAEVSLKQEKNEFLKNLASILYEVDIKTKNTEQRIIKNTEQRIILQEVLDSNDNEELYYEYLGNDDSLWFYIQNQNINSNLIKRIAPNNSITNYVIPTPVRSSTLIEFLKFSQDSFYHIFYFNKQESALYQLDLRYDEINFSRLDLFSNY